MNLLRFFFLSNPEPQPQAASGPARAGPRFYRRSRAGHKAPRRNPPRDFKSHGSRCRQEEQEKRCARGA